MTAAGGLLDPARIDHDPLGVRGRARRRGLLLAGLIALTVVSAGTAAVLGPVLVPPSTVARIVAHALGGPGEVSWAPDQEAVVWAVRVPRVLLALAVGAGLAVCGAALQTMTRNLLADPHVLGVSSGASCGAAAALLFGLGAGLGQYALFGSAFAGALAASALVFGVARHRGEVTSVRLVLAGVAVGYALSAATSFLVFASGSAEGARSVMFWLLGSLSLARWGMPLAVVALVVVAACLTLVLWSPGLDALALGDETARTLGISPSRLRTRLLLLVSLTVGVVVAAAGTIGFVGLVVPHLARRLVGVAHRWLIPVAALLGGSLLLWADVLARLIRQPQELPIGIVTALVGAPFLLHLVRSRRAVAVP